ncbi:hypothetical protein DL240_13180 [Lujinxingia litoralis]|uniref:Uncharacterized protein n=1 Tax=Lujinxingia litoralis TaxID=2211119 RepID=A0A328C4X6_9DELT|nr:hypothetical protein [Lujinxingia litoralis]RAL21799.1 hypothetical protein DL240_13180 [Lujinxingia litoralis]
MLKHLLVLGVFCVLVFGAFTALAFVFSPDNSPPVDHENDLVRTRNDQRIVYYGRAGYYGVGRPGLHRSGRLGSVGNRSFRGGGLHGGK